MRLKNLTAPEAESATALPLTHKEAGQHHLGNTQKDTSLLWSFPLLSQNSFWYFLFFSPEWACMCFYNQYWVTNALYIWTSAWGKKTVLNLKQSNTTRFFLWHFIKVYNTLSDPSLNVFLFFKTASFKKGDCIVSHPIIPDILHRSRVCKGTTKWMHYCLK